jgi:hypothetical protein
MALGSAETFFANIRFRKKIGVFSITGLENTTGLKKFFREKIFVKQERREKRL